MDISLIIAVAAVALAAGAIIFALRSRGADPEVMRLAQSQSELVGSLRTLVDQSAAAQAATAERLQAQERALAKALEDRFADITKRVGEHLEKSAQATSTTIGDLRERLVKIDEAQKHLAELSSHVVSLQDILSNKQARGAFGEIQLADLVRGALPPSAYEFQATLAGGQRADCLLRLPNPPGPICIDAKFPLESYRALKEARDEAALVQARRDFSQAIRTHFRAIAEKYIRPGETAESALMFLPSEAVYAELHASFPNVVEESFRHRVWIVSPTTLMATLTTIRAVLKDVRMREQAGLIQKEVHALLQDVGRLDDRVGKLQRHFAQANDDLRDIRISTEKIARRGDRIEALELDEPASADAEALLSPRAVAAGE